MSTPVESPERFWLVAWAASGRTEGASSYYTNEIVTKRHIGKSLAQVVIAHKRYADETNAMRQSIGPWGAFAEFKLVFATKISEEDYHDLRDALGDATP